MDLTEKETQWIRPVSARNNQEVSEYERQYLDGSDPKLLDIIDIPLLSHQPQDCQRENWLLDPEQYWKKVGVFEWGKLKPFSETRGTLWQNGDHTQNGLNDQISLVYAKREVNSLKLIYVDRLQLRVFASWGTKRRVQAHFRFDSSNYKLWVTDPCIEQAYLAKRDGFYRLDKCYLTVSLGELFKGYHHKLIAAILEEPL